MSISLSDIVQMMGGVQGINWDALASQGKNTVFHPEYILDYLLPAYGRADAVFKTLDFKPTSDADLIENYRLMKKGLEDPLEFAKQAFRAGASQLLPGQGFKLTDAELRAFTYYTWLAIQNGAYMHTQVLIHYALAKRDGGQLSRESEQEIADHANWITTMCNLLPRLNAMGLFKPIKKAGMAGTPYVMNGLSFPGAVGALPVVALVVIIIAAIAGLAYLLLGITEVTAREATVYNTCKEAAVTGDQGALELCRDLSKSTPSPSGDLATTVMWIAGLAAGGYALIAFGPAIAQSLKQALEKREKAANAT